MTPPPMMTTWARSGGDVLAMYVSDVLWSVGGVYVVEQAGDMRAVEFGDGGLVAFHRPAPEVVLQCAGGALDAAPQCPAVLGDDALQVGSGGLVPQCPAVVRGDELIQLVGGQATLAPDVAELEAGIVVAGVLVVDDPHSV